ncbi:MAG: GEVED domain-containing protein [Flavobacteriaceae bacterium]|nr:GEVED domain-containing protein [Flavobacteriaceae bacterium]
MKFKNYFLVACLMFMGAALNAQQVTENVAQGVDQVGVALSMEYIPSMASRPYLIPAEDTFEEAQDRRSIRNKVVIGKDKQSTNDYFYMNRHETEQSLRVMPPSVVFDAYSSNSQPTDPSMAVGLDHVFVVYNTGYRIFDKAGNALTGQLNVTNIFSSGGCCDLTASYDSAADRWVISYLFGNGNVQVAVSDGPDPLASGWYVYTYGGVNDYQKLSVWSDGYYMTANVGGANKVWALERDEMLAGNASAGFQTFNLPGLVTSGFYSPQALNISNNNYPAAGGATIIYLQDDAWGGVSQDHIKIWTIDVDWTTPGNSAISAATQINTTPFISVFDGGGFSNLTQPNNGIAIDALQATIMNQAQFRKFGTHNSAIFNHVVDVDATGGELAGVRWYEFRQTADNQPWTLYQEGTYTAPDGRHAWHASMVMDGSGNIGMGYSSMSGPTTPDVIRVSSYYTGRFDGDALGTMTVAEEVIANGNANIPGLRYGDYSKMDIDPADDATFWFLNEYMNSGRKGVVGAFILEPSTAVDDIGVTSITSPSTGQLTSAEEIIISVRNFGINAIVDPEVQYTINGGTAVVETFTGVLAPGATESYTFATTADLSVQNAFYEIVSRTNWPVDTNGANDEATKTVQNSLIYCNPNINCSFGDGFTLVSVNEINNPSACEGYGDFTSQVATFAAGGTYQVTFSTGYGDQNIKGWIDFNDDGVFGTNELVVQNFVIAPGQGAGSYTETTNLVIPAGVADGVHRMRFKSNWQAEVPADACEETNYGEVEDYSADVDGVLGINELAIEEADLLVTSLPNNQFDIALVTRYDDRAAIGIYNVLGQVLAFNYIEKEGDRFNYQLDMSYAAAGVYIIKMGDIFSNAYKTAKIIVK